MKFGVNTFIWSDVCDEAIIERLPMIHDWGFDGVEVPMFRANGFPAERLRRAVAAYEIECTICSALVDGANLISEDPDIRRRTVEAIRSLVRTTADAGAKCLAGPMYAPVGYLPGRRRTSDEWNWAVEGLCTLGEDLAANDVVLAVEPLNRFETYFLNTAADAEKLVSEVNHPNIGILFDTFHANIEEKSIANGIRTVRQHLRHVHTCENDRGIPGSGHVEWVSVFDALRDAGYDGWLTIESFGFAVGDLSAAAAIWRDIEVTSEVIASEGIRFLRDKACRNSSPSNSRHQLAEAVQVT